MILEYSRMSLGIEKTANGILKSHYAIRINVHLPFVTVTAALE